MTNSRSLSWIDRGRWAGLLAKVTDEDAGDAPVVPQGKRAAPARPRPTMPRPTMPARASTAPETMRIAVPPPVAPQGSRTLAGPMPAHTARRPASASAFPSVPPPPAVPAAPPAPAYHPFASSAFQLEERLQALVAWIEDCVPCRAAFVADDNGLPVVEHLGAEPGHIAAASSILLMLASVRTLMRDSGGWLSLKLGAQVLNVVEVATRWGRFGIGVVTDDALPREFLLALSAAVERAFHGEPSQGE